MNYPHSTATAPTFADEQAERIKEAVADYYANPTEYSALDFEDIFEDRDPFEFI